MEDRRFDQFVRSLVASHSRRRTVAVLVGLVAWLRVARTAADEDGSIIVDASGGNGNLAGQRDRRRRSAPVSSPTPTPTPTPCASAPQEVLCAGTCNREVVNSCGESVRCTCPVGEACGPGDLCCPLAHLCLASNVCCGADQVCAAGGGVCCAPERVCSVGGVLNACCGVPGICVNGICTIP